MKNFQKGFIVPLLLAIIAVLVVGGGVYVYKKEKKVDAPSVVDTETKSEVSSTDISNWNTYRNEKYGIEFKYPITAGLYDYSKSSLSLDVGTNPSKAGLLSIYVGISAQSFNELEKQLRKHFNENSTIEKVTFSGESAIKVSLSGAYEYYILKNRFKYIIGVPQESSGNKNSLISPKILSTFKFTK